MESIIFDQMLPRIANYYTEAEMRALVGALPGGSPFVEFVQRNSGHARITRRAGNEQPAQRPVSR